LHVAAASQLPSAAHEKLPTEGCAALADPPLHSFLTFAAWWPELMDPEKWDLEKREICEG
jgi:hypothetical protein